MGDGDSRLLLFQNQVRLRKLVDRFVQESRTTHCGLTDGQVKYFIRRFVLEKLLQAVFHKTLSQHFGSVIAGGFLPVSTGQAVDKTVLPVLFILAVLRFDPFIFIKLRKLITGYKNCRFEVRLIIVLTLVFYLEQILPGDKAPVRQQPFIHRSQLVDPELHVTYPPTTCIVSSSRPAKTHQFKHFMQNVIRKHDLREHGGVLRIE